MYPRIAAGDGTGVARTRCDQVDELIGVYPLMPRTLEGAADGGEADAEVEDGVEQLLDAVAGALAAGAVELEEAVGVVRGDGVGGGGVEAGLDGDDGVSEVEGDAGGRGLVADEGVEVRGPGVAAGARHGRILRQAQDEREEEEPQR
jgi:hypothetical protein